MMSFQGEFSGGGIEGEEMNLDIWMQNSSRLWSLATLAAVPAVIAETPGHELWSSELWGEGSGFRDKASAIVLDLPAWYTTSKLYWFIN